MAASTGAPGPTAGFLERLGAAVIDWLIVGALVGTLAAVFSASAIVVLAAEAVAALTPNGDISSEQAVALALQAGVFGLGLALASVLAKWAYFVLFTGLKGQTPGKMVVGLRVVDDRGNVPGIARAIMREVVGKFISGLVLNLGYLWVIWDGQKQGWHDKIADTYVVRVTRT